MSLPRLLSLAFAVCLVSAAQAEDPLVGLVSSHFDLNSDSAIDTGEWQNGIDDAFDELDRNVDGVLSKDDLGDLKEALASSHGEVAATVITAAIGKAVEAFDADQSQGVSREEFTAGCNAVFKKLDANADGTVTAEELLSLPTLE